MCHRSNSIVDMFYIGMLMDPYLVLERGSWCTFNNSGVHRSQVQSWFKMEMYHPMILVLDYSAMVLTDGSLWTFGRNNYGQLGDGTTTDRLTPVKIVDENVTKVASWRIAHRFPKE